MTGSLRGLSFAAKDIFDIAGSKAGFGHPQWLDACPPATKTASVIEKLLAEGCDLVGKTQTHALALGLTGENPHYGTPLNPRAQNRVPGGSSSGSAAATAGGLVDFALGTDTGGSVRAPAAFCGIYGLRPTHGRVPVDGVCKVAPSFDTVGWFACDLETMRRVGQVILDKYQTRRTARRLVYLESAFETATPKAAGALNFARHQISGLAAIHESSDLGKANLDSWYEVYHVLRGYETWSHLGAWVRSVKPDLDPVVRDLLGWASTLTVDDTKPMQRRRQDITSYLTSLLSGDSVLVLPTVHDIAPLLGCDLSELSAYRAKAMSLLCIAGLAGLPQINIPIGLVDGCPFGLSLIGPSGGDEMLIATAIGIENCLATSHDSSWNFQK